MSTYRASRKPALVCALAVACTYQMPGSNPYDPDTPPERQAAAKAGGHVVLAETGASAAGGRVRLLDTEDQPVLDDAGAPRLAELQPEPGDGQGAGLGEFSFGGLAPGTYRLAFLVDARFQPPALPDIVLGPGEQRSLGNLVFTRVDVGSGRIRGEVRVEDSAAGARTVKLWRRIGGGLQVIAEQQTDAAGTFDLAGLPPGTYAVGGELTGFTPDFGFGLVLDAPGALVSEIVLEGEKALRLYSAAAVLLPNLERQFGRYYTSGRDVPLLVLQFGGMQEMRLSVSPRFADAAGQDIPFVPFVPASAVTLPEQEGEFPVYAQFRLEKAGFAFTSDVYSAAVVRDATAPDVVDLSVRGHAPDAEGFTWIREDAAVVGVDFGANDATSGVGGSAVVHDPDRYPAELDRVPLDRNDSPSGYVRFAKEVALGAGEGLKSVYVLLKDRAGNSMVPRRLDLLVDRTPPALDAGETVAAENATPRGEISDTAATLRVRVAPRCRGPAPSGAPGECAVLMRAGAAPLPSSAPWLPVDLGTGGSVTVPVEGGNGQPVSFVVELRDAAGNEASYPTPIYVLKLTGHASGRVLVQGYPDGAPQHGGIAVGLFDAAGPRTEPVAVADSSTDGTFVLRTPAEPGQTGFEAIPAGRFIAACARADLEPFEASVEVRPRMDETFPTWRVQPARGNVRGRVLRGDLRASPAAHGGIEVDARRSGVEVARTFTADDGSFSFASPGLPVTTGGAPYEMIISATGYVARRLPGVEVARDEVAVLQSDGGDPPRPEPVELTRLSGDFEFCAAPAGECVPVGHTKEARIRARLLDDTGVDEVRARARTPFEADAEAPAWRTYDPEGILVDVAVPPADSEGAVEVFLQTRTGGTAGAVLHSVLVVDRTPPAVASFSLESGREAVWQGFTRTDTVRATVGADPGAGEVAPLQGAWVAFADAAPAGVPDGATACLVSVACTVPLPRNAAGDLLEGTLMAWAFACDAAGNCTGTPVPASVVRDATPPASAHGTAFEPSAAWIVPGGTEWFTRSPRVDIAVSVGAARTAEGVQVRDLSDPPQAVPDVAAYRFGFREDLADAAWQEFPTHPSAGGRVVVAGPVLSGDDGRYRIYAQLKDAAGNTTSTEANPRHADLVLDQTAPVVSFQLNAGAAWTTDARVRLEVAPAAGDPGPPRELLVSKDGGLFAAFERRALPLAGDDTAWTPPAGPAPDGDGAYTVVARFLDAAGNAADRSATIWLDRTPPALRSAACGSCRLDASTGEYFSAAADRQIVLDFSALDNSGRVARAKVAVDGGPAAEAPYTGTAVAVLGNSDGAHRVDLGVLDPAGNESETRTLTVHLDRALPDMTVSIDGGAAHARQGTVVVTVANRDGASVRGLRVSNSATFTGAVLPFADSTLWTLATPELDGEKTVYAEVTDPAGNTVVASDTIILDGTPPTGVSLVLADGKPYTSTGSVPCTIAASDAVSAASALRTQVSEDPTFAAIATEAFATTKTVPLSEGDGPKTLFLRVFDEAGNQTGAFDTIVLDTERPQAAAIRLSSGAVTRATNAVATLSSGGATEMCLHGDIVGTPQDACAADSTAWEPVATSKSMVLTESDGTKTVTALFRDAGGLTTDPVLATTVLDRTPPTGVDLAVIGGSGFTPTASLPLSIAATDQTSASLEMQLTEGPTFAGATWERLQSQRTYTLSPLEGPKTVYLRVRDGAGNTSSDSVSLVYDRTAPTGVSLTIGDGPLAVSNPVVSLSIGGADSVTHPENLRMMVSTDPSFGGAAVEAFASEKTGFTLPGGDGAKTVFVKVMDEAGNGTTASATVVLDTEKPSGERLTLTPSGATSSTAVVASVYAAGASQMCLRGAFAGSPENCDADGYGWEDFRGARTLTLTAGDGTKGVTAVVRDAAGNTSAETSASIVLDQAPPTELSVSLAGGSRFTRTSAVSLLLAAKDAAALEMQVSEDATFALATWEGFQAQKAFALSPGEGPKTVYLRVRDPAANTASASAGLVYDRTPPSAVSVALSGEGLTSSGGQEYTNTPEVTANLEGIDNVTSASDLLMRVSQDANFSGAAPVPFAAEHPVTLAGADGEKTVYVEVMDQAGNATTASANVVLLRAAPSGQAVSLSAGAFTGTTGVVAALTAFNASEMCLHGDFAGSVADSCTDSSTGWEPFAVSKPLVLTEDDGLKTVTALFRNASHLTTDPVSAATTMDKTAPSAVSIRTATGATHTPVATVPFALAATDDSSLEMEVSEDSTFASAVREPFQTQKVFTLSPTEGPKTVYLRVRDPAGNTGSASTQVVYDRTPPAGVSVVVGGANVVAGGGMAHASAAGVVATLAATDNLSGTGDLVMRVAQDPTFAGAVSEAFAATRSMSLAGADGPKAVYLEVRDQAGNTATATTAVILARAAPTGQGISLSSGTHTKDAAAVAYLTAAGAAQMCLFGDFTGSVTDSCAPASPGWEAFAASKSLTLTTGDGTKTVNALFRNEAQVATTPASASTVLDQKPPASVSIAPATGSSYTATATVPFTLAATDASALEMQLTEDSTYATATWEEFQAQKAFTLSQAQGSRTVYLRVRDRALNLAEASTTVVFDKAPPAGVTLSISGANVSQAGGQNYARAPQVTLVIAGSDAVSAAADLRMRVSEDPTFAGIPTEAFSTSKGLTLSAGDGPKAVYLEVQDQAGNRAIASATVVLATAPPTGETISLSSGAYTKSTAAVARLYAVGASEMCLFGDFTGSVTDSCAEASTGWEAYATTKSLVLSAGDGTKTAGVLFRNVAHLTTAPRTASTTLDETLPAGVSIAPATESGFTATATVPFTLTATDASPLEMQVTEDSTFAAATWEPFQVQKAFTLTSTQGTKTVYLRVRDPALNVADASATVVYDKAPPAGVSLSIGGAGVFTSGGQSYAGSTAVTVTLAASDNITASADLKTRVSEDPTFAGLAPEAFATSKALTLSSGDGPKAVYAEVRDQAGNTASASATVILATAPPTAQAISLSSGEHTRGTSTVARLSAVGATQMCLYGDFAGSVSDACTTQSTGWEPYASSKPLTLSSGDGLKTVQVVYRNVARLATDVASASTTLDHTLPSGLSIAPAGGSGFTSSRSVTLSLAASDDSPLEMQVTEDSTFAAATWESFQTQKTFVLSSSEGPKTVYLRVRDLAQNTQSASTSLVYDKTPPSGASVTPGGGNIAISAGQAYSSGTSVTVALTASDTVTGAADLRMRVSQNPTFAGASVEPFATSKTLTLAGSDGTKTIYVEVRDQAENTAVATATVILAAAAPGAPSISLSSGADTKYTAATATLSAAGAAEMCLYGDFAGSVTDACAAASPGWEAYATSKALTLKTPDGPKTVQVAYRNAARVLSTTASASTTLDQTAPAGLSIAPADGAGYTAVRNVTVALGASDAAPLEMQLSEDSTFAGATWESFQAQKSFALSAAEGTRSVYFRVRDAARNEASASTSIVYDKSAPFGASVVIGGAGVVATDGIVYSDRASVTATLTANDAISSTGNLVMRVATDATFAGASQETFATTKSLTLPGGDGTKTVYLEVRDQAGNTATASAPVMLATAPPTGQTISLSSGAYTKDLAVAVSLNAAGAAKMCLYGDFAGSPSDTCAASSVGWEPYASSKSLTLAGNDGVKTISVSYRNGARVATSAVSASTTLDRAEPSGVSISTADGSTFTSSATVALTLGAADLAPLEMQVTEDSTFASAKWEAFSTQKVFALSSTEGFKRIYFRVRDPALNTKSASTTATYDRSEPTGVTVTINGGASATADPDVALGITGIDNLTSAANLRMAISQDPNLSGAVPVAFATSTTAVLAGADDTKFVYVKVIDEAGNSTTAYSSIVLDRSIPSSPSIALSSGKYAKNTSAVAALASAGASQMCLYGDFNGSVLDACAPGSGGWEEFSATKNLVLATGDGLKTVTALFRNDALATTDAVSASTTLDEHAPTGVSIVAADGATDTATPTIVVTLAASDANPMETAVTEGSPTSSTVYEAFQTRKTITLSSAEGQKTLVLTVRDSALNPATASTTITYDKTPPVGVSVTLTAADGSALPADAGGQKYTSAAGIKATVDATGAATLLISQDANFTTTDYAGVFTTAARSIALAGTDGTKTVYAKVLDNAGNATTALATVVLAASAPTGPTIALSAGTYTGNPNVTATLSAAGAAQMCLFGDFEGSATDSCTDASSGWVTYATSKAVKLRGKTTVPQGTYGDGAKTVNVVFRNSAKVATTATSASTTLDENAPTGVSIAVADGASDTASPTIVLTLAASDTYPLEMAVTEGAPTSGTTYEPFQSRKTFTLSATENTKTLYLTVRDGALNPANATTTITYDKTAPTAVSIVLTAADGSALPTDAGGQKYAASAGVKATVAATGATGMYISQDPNFSYNDYAGTYTSTGQSVTLSGADGAKTVYAKVFDNAGNATTALATVVLAKAAPTGPTIALSAGTYTGNPNVTATLSAASAAQMCLYGDFEGSATDSCTDASSGWVAYATSKAVKLRGKTTVPQGTYGDGAKTVNVVFRNSAKVATTATSASTTLDENAPTGVSIAVADGATDTASPTIVLTLAASDAYPMEMAVTEGAPTSGTTYEPFQSRKTFTLSATENTKTLYLTVRDGALNPANATTTIAYDKTAPTAVSITLAASDGSALPADASGQKYTASASVKATVAATGATGMYISQDPNFSSNDYAGTHTSTGQSVTLSGADGAKTVYAKVFDNAGNSTTALATVVLAKAAPTGPTIALSAGAYTGNPNVTATLSAAGASQMCLFGDFEGSVTDSCTDASSGWVTYATSRAVKLRGKTTVPQGTYGDGAKTVNVVFRNSAKVATTATSASTTLDENAPTGVSIAVADGASDTASPTIVLTLAASDAYPMEMAVTEGAPTSGTTYEPFQSRKTFTLSATENTKTLYLTVRDGALNPANATTTITYDKTAPTAVSIVLTAAEGSALPADAGGQKYAAAASVKATVAATGATGMYISQDPNFSSSDYSGTYTSTGQPVTLSGADGAKTVYAKVFDNAGNSTTALATVVLAKAAPTGPTIALSAGTCTGNPSVTATLSAAGAAQMCLFGDFEGSVTDSCTDASSGWVAYGTSKAVKLRGKATVPQGTYGDGAKTVNVVFRNSAKVATTATSASTTLDENAPTGVSIAVADGASDTASPTIVLTLAASDAYPMEMAVTEGAPTSGTTYEPFQSRKSFTLSATENTKTLYLTVRDGALNPANATTIITYDKTAPTAVSIALTAADGSALPPDAGGQKYTASASVKATVAATGATGMYISQDPNFSSSDYSGTYTSTGQSVTLSGADGAKTVYAKVFDNAGNATTALATVVLAAAAPTGPTIALSAGAYTGNPSVTAALSAAGASQMCLFGDFEGSVTDSCTDASSGWVTYATSKAVKLRGKTTVPQGTYGDGAKTVSVVFRNSAKVATTATSASTTLDETAPGGLVIAIGGNPSYTSTPTLVLTLGATDANPMEMAVTEGAPTSSTVWEPFQTQKTFRLSTTEGLKTLYLSVRDAALNPANVTTQITYDRTAPSAVSLTLAASDGSALPTDASGTPYAGSAGVKASVAATGAATMMISQDANFVAKDYSGTFTTDSQSVTLSGGDGTKTVYARVEDEAGNATTVMKSAVLAKTAPAGPTIALSAGTYSGSPDVTATLSAAGATQMCLYGDFEGSVTDSCTDASSGWVTYGTSKAVKLKGRTTVPQGTYGDGLKTVNAVFRNGAKVATAAVSATTTLDENAPTGVSIAVADGASDTASPTIVLTLAASDAYPLEMAVTEGAPASGTTYEPFQSRKTFTLSVTENTKTLCLTVRDGALNPANATTTVTYDRTAPTVVSLVLSASDGSALPADSGGQKYTSATGIKAAVTATGATKLILSQDPNFSTQSYSGTYTATGQSVTLSGADGMRTIYAKVLDNAGNSAAASTTVVLDTAKPTDARITLSPAGATNSTSVTATLAASGASAYCLYGDIAEGATDSCAAVSLGWTTFSTSTVSLHVTGTDTTGFGTKTVRALFRDAARLTTDAASDSVVYDKGAPTVSVALNPVAGFVRSQQVILAVDASDPNDYTPKASLRMQVSEDSTFAYVPWETYAVSRAFTLGAADGAKKVYVKVRDAALNEATNYVQVTLDATPPSSASIVIDSGNAYTSSSTRSVSLTISASDAISGTTLKMQYSEDPTFANVSTWLDYATGRTFTLSDGDGTKTVYLRVKDEAGNIAGASDSIVLDRVGPTSAVMALRETGYTKNATQWVDISVSGATEMCLWGDFVGSPADCTSAATPPWMAFASSKQLTLTTAANGKKTVNARFRDDAKNVSATDATTSIVYDDAAPYGLALSVNDGATYTTSLALSLAVSASDLQAPDTALTMKVWESGGSVPNGEILSRVRSFSLAAGLDGERTLNLQVADPAGNTGSTTGKITLDRGLPIISTFRLNGFDVYTDSATDVVATIYAADALDAAADLDVQLSEDPTFAGATWADYQIAWRTTGKVVSLSTGDGVKTVYLRVKDRAGNTAQSADSIILDTNGPTGASISVSAGDYTNSTTVVLDLAATGATKVCVRGDFSGSPADCPPAPATSGWVDLTSTQKTVTVTDSATPVTYSFSAYFRDAAGNTTSAATDSVLYDRQVPTIGTVKVNGGSPSSTTSLAVMLTVDSATDGTTGSGLSGIAISNSTISACSGATYVPFASQWAWTLASGDGDKTIDVCVKDKAGNFSAKASKSIKLDAAAPVGVSITLANGATWTTTQGITASITASDAISNADSKLTVKVSENADFSGATAVTLAAFKSAAEPKFALSTGDGLKRVFLLVTDEAGNSTMAADTILLDTTAPSVADTAGIRIDGGTDGNANATDSSVVTVSLYAALDATTRRPTATRVRLHRYETATCVTQPTVQASDFDADEDIGYASNLTFVLPAGSGECKWVGVRYGDEAGNWIPATGYKASILLDTLAPGAPVIETTAQTVAAASVDIDLAANSVDSPNHFMKYQVLQGGSTRWTDVATGGSTPPFHRTPTCVGASSPLCTISVSLAGGTTNRENYIGVRGVDTAGNTSPAATVVITRDASAPLTPSGLALAPGDGRIGVSWTANTESDLGGYLVYYTMANGTVCSASKSAYTGAFAQQGPSPVDVGSSTSLQLAGTPNGMPVCVAVSAYDRTDVPGRRESSLTAAWVAPGEVAPAVRARLGSTLLGLSSSAAVGALAVRNGLLYAATTEGLVELDVSNEDCFDLSTAAAFATCTGLVKSSTALSDPRDMVLVGRYAYVADYLAGLKVFSITEGTAPVYVRTVVLTGITGTYAVNGVAWSGNVLAASHANGYALLTLGASLDNPTLAVKSTSYANTTDIDVQGDRMFLARDPGSPRPGGTLFDVSTPSAPAAMSPDRCAIELPPTAVRFSGRYLYSVGANTSAVCDVESTTTVAGTSYLTLTSQATVDVGSRAEVAGPYLYAVGTFYSYALAGNMAAIELVDVSDRNNIRQVGRHQWLRGSAAVCGSGSGSHGSLAVEGNRVFATDGCSPDILALHTGEIRSMEAIGYSDAFAGTRDVRMVRDSLVVPYYKDYSVQSIQQVRRTTLAASRIDSGTDTYWSVETEGDRVAMLGDTQVSIGVMPRGAGAPLLDDMVSVGTPDWGTSPVTAKFHVGSAAFQWPYLFLLNGYKASNSTDWHVLLTRVHATSPGDPYSSSITSGYSKEVATFPENGDAWTFKGLPSVGLYGGKVLVGVLTYAIHSGAMVEDGTRGVYSVPYTLGGTLSNPTHLWDDADVADLVVYGRYAYFLDNNYGLYAQSLAASSWAPKRLGNLGTQGHPGYDGSPISTYGTYRPVLAGNYLFLPRSGFGTWVYRINFVLNTSVSPNRHDPDSATLVGTYDFGSSPSAVNIAGDRVYITNLYRGTDIFRLR